MGQLEGHRKQCQEHRGRLGNRTKSNPMFTGFINLRHLVGTEDPIPTGNIVMSPVPLPLVCPSLKVGTSKRINIKQIIIP